MELLMNYFLGLFGLDGFEKKLAVNLGNFES